MIASQLVGFGENLQAFGLFQKNAIAVTGLILFQLQKRKDDFVKSTELSVLAKYRELNGRPGRLCMD
jgi:hypothetical protein